ncbi:MAG: BACON domain-containing protein [Flavobacteriaceae bacterium]|nr:BACON domain-containing protein [Flavobacteriaceae bacterium]
MEESLLMKSINRVFSFLFFVLLFACSTSEPTAEEVIPESLIVSSFVLFSATEETRSINISSNLDWRINNSLDWVTISPTAGSNNGAINLTVTSNPTSTQREGVISLTGGSLSRTIQIR